MNCENYSNLIEDLIAGELDEQTAGRVDSHVFACPKCAEQYETLEREKKIYAHYLFETEPPQDLWKNFQARLNSEKKISSYAAETQVLAPRRRTNIFAFFRLSPSLAAASVLLFALGIGFVWLKTAPVEKAGDRFASETKSGESKSPPQSGEIDRQATTNLPLDAGGETVAAPRNKELLAQNQSSGARENSLSDERKSSGVKTVKIGRKIVSSDEKKRPANKNLPAAEKRLTALRRQKLETEIAGQIEQVEMLLRSFRNARTIEDVETFDVEYERMQARKLLGKNSRLRRDAETCEIFYAEELLNQIEPYLLEIANLEARPAPDKVLDIKERVVNQNIIASLQVYK